MEDWPAVAMRSSRQIQGEEEIIAQLAPLAAGYPGAFGLQDDCALLTPEPGTELVLKTDPIAEGVHFLPDDAPEDIAWKALAVNVSDLAAKAATPVGYLLALSFPAAPTEDWLRRFAGGLEAAQRAFGCHLLGGDTDRRPGPLTISVTAIGRVDQGRMMRRGTARAGDTIFVSGTIGDAALGLALRKDKGLADAWGLSLAEVELLRLRYTRPSPRLALGPALLAHASAAMDVSDGLVKDLGRLVRASGVSARIETIKLPFSAAAARVIAREPARLLQLIGAGDDYEILAAVPASEGNAFAHAARQAGLEVAAIGQLGAAIKGEPPVQVIASDGALLHLASPGWDHF
jgi:thiamine-monophosphate kinase